MSASEFGQSLSIENLAKHDSLETSQSPDEINTVTPIRVTPRRGSRKRPLSRQTSVADMSEETMSVQSKSSYIFAHYRLFSLEKVRIIVRPGPLPRERDPTPCQRYCLPYDLRGEEVRTSSYRK